MTISRKRYEERIDEYNELIRQAQKSVEDFGSLGYGVRGLREASEARGLASELQQLACKISLAAGDILEFRRAEQVKGA